MNATPSINTNPVNTVQSAASGKPQDTAADVPFNQVLSSEMAQKRSEMAQKRSGNGSPEKTDVDSSATDPNVKPAAVATDADTLASEAQEAQTLVFPVMPETLLALAIPPDALKAVPASGNDIPVDQPLSLDVDASTSGDKGRSAPFQAGQLPDETVDVQQPDTAPVGKAKLQAATQAATTVATQAQAQTQATSTSSASASTSASASISASASASASISASASATSSATAFAGQLAAATQADTLKTKEPPAELMSSATMRPTTQAAFNLPSIDPLASNKLAPSVGTSAWSQALGDKVVWMAAGAQQTASLTLNPPNMGPLQIVLNITNDQATASFFSAQPEVRQALEAAFPKLREMMNEAGIQLGQATVGAENPRQNDPSDRQAQRLAAPFNVTDDGVAIGQLSPNAVIQHSGRGLVDTFA
jgi:flagellar hook-length control protein FliK